MSGLEQIVRPFQTPVVITTKKIFVTTEAVEVTEAVLEWGDPGEIAQPQQIDDPDPEGGVGFTVKDKEKWAEKSRKTSDKRVENPDDASQFVIVQQVDSVKFGKKTTGRGGKLTSVSSSSAPAQPLSGMTQTNVPGEPVAVDPAGEPLPTGAEEPFETAVEIAFKNPK